MLPVLYILSQQPLAGRINLDSNALPSRLIRARQQVGHLTLQPDATCCRHDAHLPAATVALCGPKRPIRICRSNFCRTSSSRISAYAACKISTNGCPKHRTVMRFLASVRKLALHVRMRAESSDELRDPLRDLRAARARLEETGSCLQLREGIRVGRRGVRRLVGVRLQHPFPIRLRSH